MKIAYDFHIHSCLSLCAEDDCTPASIAGMAMLAGLNAFSISDHQSAKNCVAAAKAAEEYGLLFVPALELETAEEVHILCLFERVESALAFSDYVGERLLIPYPPKRLLWRQSVMDEHDNVIFEEDKWLGSPSSIGVYEAYDLVKSFGGLAIPAHIDRPSHALLSNLGFFDLDMKFKVFEISGECDLPALLDAHPELRGSRFIRNSDAHELASIPDATNWLDIDEPTPKGVIDALLKEHE